LQAPTGQASCVLTTAIGVLVAETVSKKLAPTWLFRMTSP